MKLNQTITKIYSLLIFICISSASYGELEKVIVYGESHLFKIDRANNWILDRGFAARQGLGSFFYPQGTQSKTNTYFYAQGWDKPNKEATLQEFIDSNIQQIKGTFPNVTFKKVKQESAGSILNSWMYTYENMGSRFKEEVIYLESETAVITLVFSTSSKDDYEQYVSDFDLMASSFMYLSSDKNDIQNALNGRQ